MVLTSAMAGFILGLCLAFVRNMLLKIKENSDGRQKLQTLAKAWRL
jgi:hypothetical protein